jgi:hypothetical protein
VQQCRAHRAAVQRGVCTGEGALTITPVAPVASLATGALKVPCHLHASQRGWPSHFELVAALQISMPLPMLDQKNVTAAGQPLLAALECAQSLLQPRLHVWRQQEFRPFPAHYSTVAAAAAGASLKSPLGCGIQTHPTSAEQFVCPAYAHLRC